MQSPGWWCTSESQHWKVETEDSQSSQKGEVQAQRKILSQKIRQRAKEEAPTLTASLHTLTYVKYNTSRKVCLMEDNVIHRPRDNLNNISQNFILRVKKNLNSI